MHKKIITTVAVAGFGLAMNGFAAAEESVEVLHWWTSGGEASALNVLKQDLEKEGIGWQDMPVAGGGGEQAMTALRARHRGQSAYRCADATDILDWGKQGVVEGLNDMAAKEGWDKVVPNAAEVLQVQRQVDRLAGQRPLHQWVWANKEAAKAGITSEPKTWDEFIADAEKVQKAGFIAIAHGGQPWQDATIFDGVVMSTGGIDYYRKAFIDLDQKAINSPTTEKVFQRMSQIRKLVDKDFSGRDWNVASGMVISGKAGFQMMGDWAKGEFLNAKKEPRRIFCAFARRRKATSFNTDRS
jgi:glucose/mannose transport system substrate-binding protein